jgi:hypothetical protein
MEGPPEALMLVSIWAVSDCWVSTTSLVFQDLSFDKHSSWIQMLLKMRHNEVCGPGNDKPSRVKRRLCL